MVWVSSAFGSVSTCSLTINETACNANRRAQALQRRRGHDKLPGAEKEAVRARHEENVSRKRELAAAKTDSAADALSAPWGLGDETWPLQVELVSDFIQKCINKDPEGTAELMRESHVPEEIVQFMKLSDARTSTAVAVACAKGMLGSAITFDEAQSNTVMRSTLRHVSKSTSESASNETSCWTTLLRR